MKALIYIALLGAALIRPTCSTHAQSLDWQNYRQLLLSEHSAALKAGWIEAQATPMHMRARGGFDPKLYASYDNKNFNGKHYYTHWQSGVKWPFWAGLELKAGYQAASGNFLDPENKLPQGGQAVLGFEWNAGQGLMLDERRAELLMAQNAETAFKAEADWTRVDMLYESAKLYWTWVYAQQALNLIQQSLQQTAERHAAMKASFEQGEKPAVDTLESFIQVQNRLLDWQMAQTDAANSAIALKQWSLNADGNTFLPDPLPAPPDFPATLGPTDITEEQLLEKARSGHPDLRAYQAKLRMLELERRLKNEKRKPVFQLSYSLLGENWDFSPTYAGENAGFFVNQAKWGLDFSYPILNRKARAELQLNRIKTRQTDLERQQKAAAIEAKIRQYANERQNLYRQYALATSVMDNYQRLFEAELEKWNQGESSVFLINAREQRRLDAQLKNLKLRLEIQKNEAALLWAAGLTEW